MWRARWAYLFTLVPMALFLTFEFFMFLQALRYSVSSWNIVGPVKFIGLGNYLALGRDSIFWKALWNTVRYSLVVVPASLALSLVLAVLIYPLSHWEKTFLRWPSICPPSHPLL